MSLQAEQLFSVHGKVVVVTGGGTGIGLMIAKTLENNGATVYILGRRKEALESAAKAHAKYGKIIPLGCDVCSRDEVLSVVEAVENQHGYIDLLVNNAGIGLNRLGPIEDSADIKTFQERLWSAGTAEEFTRSFDVNVTSVYYMTVAFLALLEAANRRLAAPDDPTSQVIIISSINAFKRDEYGGGSISYAASKAAVTHLGKILANTLRRWKIRCNVIAPGLHPSELSRVTEDFHPPPGYIPLDRMGKAEDIGGLVAFLASRAGGYVTGGVHVTDGGRLGLAPSTF